MFPSIALSPYPGIQPSPQSFSSLKQWLNRRVWCKEGALSLEKRHKLFNPSLHLDSQFPTKMSSASTKAITHADIPLSTFSPISAFLDVPSNPLLPQWAVVFSSVSVFTSKSFPGGASGKKNLLANAGDLRDVGSMPGSGWSPGGGTGNPFQNSSWRTPWTEGYGPWGRKGSDMTEATQYRFQANNTAKCIHENKQTLTKEG